MSDWVRWETYVESPKKLGFKSFLYDLNIKYGTQLEVLDHDKGFFNETIRFKFIGERSKVSALRQEYMQVVNKFNFDETHENQKKNSEFVGELCKVLGAKITYFPNAVKIDIWTKSDKQDDDIYNLAKNIKKHFGIEYKIVLNSDGVTIDVNSNDEKNKIFADTINSNLDWKIEPIIINDARVSAKNKM